MDLNYNTIYHNIHTIITENSINLSDVKSMDPWSIAMTCLLAVERSEKPGKKIILPKDQDLLGYLKRIHFDKILEELNYSQEENSLRPIQMPESPNLNIQEILHYKYSDEFSARLNRIAQMFQRFGLDRDKSNLATSIVAELGNNVFDHNLFSWPTNISGCFLAAQNYPEAKRVEVAIGDPGVGFKGSLKVAFPDLKDDLEAIKKGLEGNTGRVGEKRGNGLKLIQLWTINDFSGKLIIHSGQGLVTVSGEPKPAERTVSRILGTLVQIVIHY